MALRSSNATSIAGMIEAKGPCTTPLDAAAEYLRSRIDRILPLYVLAMAPHAVVAAWLIGAISGEHRSAVPRYCVYLLVATLWRWVWLSLLQYRVQQDLLVRPSSRFSARLPWILLVRLYSNLATTWGSLLVGVPSFYGLLLGSFAAPMLLENTAPAQVRVAQTLSWIQHSGKRLLKVMFAMTFISLLLTVALFVSQAILAQTVLPSILGVNTTELNVTLDSWAWRLGGLYFIFLVLDCFWSIASVILYYDTQSRRMATDLWARLTRLQEEPA